MRSWPLPIVYTAAVITTAVLSAEFFLSASIYVAIPLALSAFLAMIGTLDLIQKRHAVLRNASHVTDYFRLPGERVVEIGRQISI